MLLIMKKILIAALAVLMFASCAEKSPHAAWTYDAVVYEMNVRQYTPEGTFAAAQAQLPRLKELGVDVIWLMPIYPIGEKERKGTLGSYYAVKDYCAVNPEFGTMQDFEAFLSEDNADVWDAQESAMRFWMSKGIDGFRCDMACEVPFEFWTKTISSLRKDWPQMYMLGEGEDPKLHESGFDASYAWELHHILNDIAQGKKGIPELLEYVKHDAERFPQDAFRLMFTSNHDENSWAGTEFERMGDAAKVMAVLTFTLPNGQPLIYTGQEMGLNHRFQFFEKDPVPAWEVNEFAQFYQELIKLRHEHPALRPGGKGGRFEVVSAEDSTLVFRRVLGNDVVTVTAQLCSPWNWNLDI